MKLGDFWKYEELNIEILKLFKSHWKHVMALDFETKVPTKSDFLTNERILVASLAWRNDGEFINGEGIETRVLFLENDREKSELLLLEKLGSILNKIKPMCIIGYGVRNYDLPLLAIKKQYYQERMNYSKAYWKIADATESAIHIDLYFILKDRGFKSLREAVHSDKFSDLPLKRSKELMEPKGNEKAKKIYRLWKKGGKKLKEYASGDVRDILLITEKLVTR